MVIPLQVRRSEIDALARIGLLKPDARGDREAVARAIGRILDRVLGRRR